MELFPAYEAKGLAATIQDMMALQPYAVIVACEREGIGWNSSGYPQTREVAGIESAVKRWGCFALAFQTLEIIGGSLNSEEIIDVMVKTGFRYDLVPQAIHTAVSEKSKALS